MGYGVAGHFETKHNEPFSKTSHLADTQTQRGPQTQMENRKLRKIFGRTGKLNYQVNLSVKPLWRAEKHELQIGRKYLHTLEEPRQLSDTKSPQNSNENAKEASQNTDMAASPAKRILEWSGNTQKGLLHHQPRDQSKLTTQ